jgi:transcriptional regulator with XRE-family HTH domain
MRIHIGELIQKRMKELGMTRSELARRIGTSSQNLGKILKRGSIDTQRLFKLSEALKTDFFQYYSMMIKPEELGMTEEPFVSYLTQHPGNPPTLKSVIIEAIAYKKDADILRRENDLQKQLIHLLEEKVKKQGS